MPSPLHRSHSRRWLHSRRSAVTAVVLVHAKHAGPIWSKLFVLVSSDQRKRCWYSSGFCLGSSAQFNLAGLWALVFLLKVDFTQHPSLCHWNTSFYRLSLHQLRSTHPSVSESLCNSWVASLALPVPPNHCCTCVSAISHCWCSSPMKSHSLWFFNNLLHAVHFNWKSQVYSLQLLWGWTLGPIVSI